MKSLTVTEIEFVLGKMKQLQKDHPKAIVVYDVEANRVLITYPLPKEFYMQGMKVRSMKEEKRT